MENVNGTSDQGKLPAGLTRKQRIIREGKQLALILVIVFAFRSICFEPFRIPSGSMIPTLMIGDFILVNKFAYGFKVPFSDWFTNPVYLWKREPPKHGDVIVFKYPRDESLNYIKRVVGVPGDEVEIKNKVVYVNGVELKMDEFPGDKISKDMDDKFSQYNLKYFHTTNGRHNYVVMVDADNYFISDYPKHVVPPGNYFVMGDNRDFSADSRAWGYVPFENIKGEALFVWFSLILPFGENDFKFRPWRIGTSIN